MRIALVLLALLIPFQFPPAATAAGNCTGTVTATTFAPAVVSVGPALSVRVVFQGDGPGYIPGECDIGWITTCQLIIDGQYVSATCAHTNGDDRCHESGVPYRCEVAMTATVPATTNLHSIQATLGMRWGCCGWIGGPEATGTASWRAMHVNA